MAGRMVICRWKHAISREKGRREDEWAFRFEAVSCETTVEM